MKITIVVLIACLALAGSAFAADDVAATFKAKCAMCHGATGAGDTGMGKSMGIKDLGSAAVQGKSDADLTTIITKGQGKMPAYGGKLSDADITGLVKYIRTLKK